MGWLAALIGVFYLIGFALLGYGLWSARRSTRAAAWPTASGTITRISVVESRAAGGADPNTGGAGGTTYEVNVRYTYAVDGVGYEGSRVAFGYGGSGNRAEQDEIYRKLNQAKAVAVRYDPSEPAVSCLSFGLHRSIRVTLAFSLTWLAFVLGFTVVWWLLSRSDPVLLDNLSVQ